MMAFQSHHQGFALPDKRSAHACSLVGYFHLQNMCQYVGSTNAKYKWIGSWPFHQALRATKKESAQKQVTWIITRKQVTLPPGMNLTVACLKGYFLIKQSQNEKADWGKKSTEIMTSRVTVPFLEFSKYRSVFNTIKNWYLNIAQTPKSWTCAM